MNFEQLKKYLSDKNLIVGSHCTNLRFIDSIKRFGISHGGDLKSTILFTYEHSLDGLKTVKHKSSNCVVVVGIPKDYANFLHKIEKEKGGSLFESEEFCEFVEPSANISNIFVLNPQYIVGIYNAEKDDFELNPKAITEQKDYKDKIQILIDQANSKYMSKNNLVT